MADSKITALTSISTSTDPANDPLVIVDVSDTSMAATGTAKKVTLNQLLGASGTATLASATITGDLTVGTGANAAVLKASFLGGYSVFENSAGTGNPSITFNNDLDTGIRAPSANTLVFDAGGFEQYRIASSGVFTWSDGAGGTRMTLNSTGLGVGTSPSYKLHVNGTDTTNVLFNGTTKGVRFVASASKYSIAGVDNTGAATFQPLAIGGASLEFQIGSTTQMTLDASGNLLVTKTTPNATVVGVQATSTGEFSSTMASAVSAQSTLNVYSTGAAAYRFYVGMNGTINATNTTISAISDARLKENVQDIDVGLGAILALKPRKFDWKEGKGKNIKGDRGFIAQEFEQVFPNLIDEWKDAAPEGEAPYKSVRQDLIPVLVKAIQELTARVQTLETR